MLANRSTKEIETFDDNYLIDSFLPYCYHFLSFTKIPQILFSSFDNPLFSSNGASIHCNKFLRIYQANHLNLTLKYTVRVANID